jgi:hypothetical protein
LYDKKNKHELQLTPVKATLEFNLPEDAADFEDARQGSEWKSAMTDLLGFLKDETKSKAHTAEEYAIFYLIRDRISDEMRERNLSVW